MDDQQEYKQVRPQMMNACARAFLCVMMMSGKLEKESGNCAAEIDHFLTKDGDDMPGKRSITVAAVSDFGDIGHRFIKDLRILQLYEGRTVLQVWSDGNEAHMHGFVKQIALLIFKAAREFLSPSPDGGGKTAIDQYTEHFERRAFEHAAPGKVAPRAVAHRLASAVKGEEKEPGIDIVAHLAAWACDASPHRARLAVLLGEFGMGKTVTCQLVAQRLLAARQKGEAAPLPIYFDLRKIKQPAKAETASLSDLIRDMLEETGETPPPPEQVIELARRDGALVIFDGLDEVGHKLSRDGAQKAQGVAHQTMERVREAVKLKY